MKINLLTPLAGSSLLYIDNYNLQAVCKEGGGEAKRYPLVEKADHKFLWWQASSGIWHQSEVPKSFMEAIKKSQQQHRSKQKRGQQQQSSKASRRGVVKEPSKRRMK